MHLGNQKTTSKKIDSERKMRKYRREEGEINPAPAETKILKPKKSKKSAGISKNRREAKSASKAKIENREKIFREKAWNKRKSAYLKKSEERNINIRIFWHQKENRENERKCYESIMHSAGEARRNQWKWNNQRSIEHGYGRKCHRKK